jgi:2-dehydro-3-deoxyphosphogluconate aldolase/(4S)-4-hydroxy-2-oxoglutarate aldolase
MDEPVSATQTRSAVVDALETCGVVAIIRLKDPAAVSPVIDALAQGGVRALEITMTVPGAVDRIREAAARLPDGFLLGAGTVVDADSARRVVDAGARFIVSPVFRPEVIDAGHACGVPVLPGCLTPTEILAAWDAGADIVKVFPATALGPTYVRDLRGPLPDVKLLPTGGVSIENAGDWIRAGACAVGIGSALLDAQAIARGDYAGIVTRARRLVDNVRVARKAA